MLFTGQFAGYAVVAVLLLLLTIPFLLLPDAVLPARRERVTVRGVVEGLWISPREHPDFGWTLLSRVLVSFGNALGTTLLLYFLMFGLGDANAADDLILLTLVYMVFVIVASIVFGRLSDVLNRRKLFVFVAAGLQGVAAVMLAFIPELSAAMVAAGILGLGYGAFLSVDQARISSRVARRRGCRRSTSPRWCSRTPMPSTRRSRRRCSPAPTPAARTSAS